MTLASLLVLFFDIHQQIPSLLIDIKCKRMVKSCFETCADRKEESRIVSAATRMLTYGATYLSTTRASTISLDSLDYFFFNHEISDLPDKLFPKFLLVSKTTPLLTLLFQTKIENRRLPILLPNTEVHFPFKCNFPLFRQVSLISELPINHIPSAEQYLLSPLLVLLTFTLKFGLQDEPQQSSLLTSCIAATIFLTFSTNAVLKNIGPSVDYQHKRILLHNCLDTVNEIVVGYFRMGTDFGQFTQ